MTTLVLADSQGKYFEVHLEEHHILSLFNSGNKVEDLFLKYQDVIPSFNNIIIQIGEEHHILSLFNSGNKVEDLFLKYQDVIPSFNNIIIQIGSNNCLYKESDVVILTKMQNLYEQIIRINPKAWVFIFTLFKLFQM